MVTREAVKISNGGLVGVVHLIAEGSPVTLCKRDISVMTELDSLDVWTRQGFSYASKGHCDNCEAKLVRS